MPLHLGTPFSNQMHVIGMEIDREGDTDEVNQSFYRYLQQLTRHMYAPLARSAKHGTNVSATILHYLKKLFKLIFV